MWRLCGLCALVFGLVLESGCAADGDKDQWDKVFKDLRGDNMQMRTDPSAGLNRSLSEHGIN
jgi:hypothetical protein